MAKKIINAVYGLLILTLAVFGIQLFIDDADATLGVSSGEVASSFSSYNSNLSGVQDDLETNIIQKVDNNTQVLNQDTDLDNTEAGIEGFGVFNIFSKNILTNFLTLVGGKLGVPPLVTGILISFVLLTLTFIFIRAFFGETKV